MSKSSLRIVVLGYIVRGPIGGLAWHHLQYVMGLEQLGYDVYFIEDSDDYPCCYDPSRHTTDTDPTYGLRFAAETFGRTGLGERWAYFDAHRNTWHGPAAAHALSICASADLVLNLSGMNPLRAWLRCAPARVLVDTDPVFTQIKNLTQPAARERAMDHTAFLSFGEGIGRSGCTIPDDGLPWRPTRQPVVLDAWRLTPPPPSGAFTTVMQWDSYDKQRYGTVEYGMKSASFGPYLGLPSSTDITLELALGGANAPRGDLVAAGWKLRDPLEVTRDPWTYQSYIQGSRGEFSVAKHGYVVSRSGWFSERSAAYMASGRPVVVQDTGFSEWLPCGEGVLAFGTPDQAREALAEVARNYRRHCERARELAEAYFSAPAVLTSLIDRVLP